MNCVVCNRDATHQVVTLGYGQRRGHLISIFYCFLHYQKLLNLRDITDTAAMMGELTP